MKVRASIYAGPYIKFSVPSLSAPGQQQFTVTDAGDLPGNSAFGLSHNPHL